MPTDHMRGREDLERVMKSEAWKVGELSKRTGLSIRALRLYDEMGLVKPSRRTASGHRLYGPEDISRLQRALSLKQLGFSLDEIRDCLDQPGFSPLQVVRMHIDKLRRHMELQRVLCERLEDLERFCSAGQAESAEKFLETIEAMRMFENYYTPEQMEALKKRREEVGPEAIRAAEQE